MAITKTTIIIMILTTIFQSITEELEKMKYLVFKLFEVLLLPKVLYAIHR